MSIFNSLTNFATSALDNLSAAFTHPIDYISSPSKTVTKTLSEPLSTTIPNVIKNTAIVGTGIALAPFVAPTIAKGVSNIVTTHPIATAIAAPVALSAVISNPTGSVKTIAKTEGALVDFGKVIANPSVSGAVGFVKEHPIVSTAAAATTAIAASGTIANLINTSAIRENTQAMEKPTLDTSRLATSEDIQKYFNALEEYNKNQQMMSILPTTNPIITPSTSTISPSQPEKVAAPVASTSRAVTKKKKKAKKKGVSKKKKTIKRKTTTKKKKKQKKRKK